MNEEPKTKYVIYETTLRELGEEAEKGTTWQDELFKYEVEHEEMSEEQKDIQNNNKWNATVSESIRFYPDKILDEMQAIAYWELDNGTRENLEEKIKQQIMDMKVRTYLLKSEQKDGTYNVYSQTEYGGEINGDTYIRNEQAMDELLRGVKRRGYSFGPREDKEDYVLIERVEISSYIYSFQDLKNKVDKLVKKFMRESLTYCIKQNKVIIPEEYIAKGIPGIEEWRGIKASKNKNNNMEKKMLRGMIRDKKANILGQMQRLVWRFPKGQNDKGTFDWSIPHLYIYGNGNKAYNKKLVTQILGEKTDAELLNMTEEEIDKAFKNYWKEVLTRAIKQIDNVETYEKEQ